MHDTLEDMTAKENEKGAVVVEGMSKNVTDLASVIDDGLMAYDKEERNVRDFVTSLLLQTGNYTAAAQRFSADRVANVSAMVAKVDDELEHERKAKSAMVEKAKKSAHSAVYLT